MEYMVLALLSVFLITGQSKADQRKQTINCAESKSSYEYSYAADYKLEIIGERCNINITISGLPQSRIFMEVGQNSQTCSGQASMKIYPSSDQTEPALYAAALCNNSITRSFGVFYQFSDTLFLHVVTYGGFRNKIQLEGTDFDYVAMKLPKRGTYYSWLPATSHSKGSLALELPLAKVTVNYTLTLKVPVGHRAQLNVSTNDEAWTYSNERGGISDSSENDDTNEMVSIWSAQYIIISYHLTSVPSKEINATYNLSVSPLAIVQTTVAATSVSTSATAASTTAASTAAVTDTVATTAATGPTAASAAAVSTSLTTVPISPPSKTPTSSRDTTTLAAVIAGNSEANTEKNSTVAVAVAVTVVVVFLLILAIIIFLYKRRRTKKSEPSLSLSTCGDKENNCYEIESRDTTQEQDMDNVYLDIVPNPKLPVGSKANKQATSYEDTFMSARQSHPYAAIGDEVVFSLPGDSQQQAIAQVDNDIYHQISTSEENKDPSTQESYSVYHLAEAFDEPKPEEKEQVSNEDADYIILEDPVDNALENPNYQTLANPLHHALKDPDYHTLENPEPNMLENPNYDTMENHEHRTLDSHEHHILENPALVAVQKTAKKTPS